MELWWNRASRKASGASDGGSDQSELCWQRLDERFENMRVTMIMIFTFEGNGVTTSRCVGNQILILWRLYVSIGLR